MCGHARRKMQSTGTGSISCRAAPSSLQVSAPQNHAQKPPLPTLMLRTPQFVPLLPCMRPDSYSSQAVRLQKMHALAQPGSSVLALARAQQAHAMPRPSRLSIHRTLHMDAATDRRPVPGCRADAHGCAPNKGHVPGRTDKQTKGSTASAPLLAAVRTHGQVDLAQATRMVYWLEASLHMRHKQRRAACRAYSAPTGAVHKHTPAVVAMPMPRPLTP